MNLREQGGVHGRVWKEERKEMNVFIQGRGKYNYVVISKVNK